MQLKTKIGLAVFPAVVVVLTIVLVLLLHHPEDKTSRSIKLNCKDDEFDQISYNVSESDGSNVTKSIKILFVEDTVNDEYYNFEEAKKVCIALGAELWQVADGQAEWNVLIQIAKMTGRSSVWLNADTTDSKCPENKEVCHQSEAFHGRGIPVKWPSFPNSNYSRLFTSVTSEKRCVYVDTQGQELLWKTGSCTSITAWGLCTKRNCQEEVVRFFICLKKFLDACALSRLGLIS